MLTVEVQQPNKVKDEERPEVIPQDQLVQSIYGDKIRTYDKASAIILGVRPKELMLFRRVPHMPLRPSPVPVQKEEQGIRKRS